MNPREASPDDASGDALLGRIIAEKIELVARLGEGAMGKVYRGYDRILDRVVAIKVLHPEASSSPNIALRFQTEARTASRLDHPNSLRIFDFGVDGEDRLLYIAMEYLEGRTFRDLLAAEGRLAPRRMSWIIGQVCSALAAAHDQGVVHRDVKPDNIILTTRRGDRGPIHDFVKVCDFGLAKVLDAPAATPNGAPITQRGTVLGTPAFMSPEQAKGETVDHRGDLYACGVMMYRALSGSNPFTGDSAWAVSLKQISEEPPPLHETAPDIDPGLARIVHRALQKDPSDRFQSARDLKQAIEDVVGAPALASDDQVWHAASSESPELAPTYTGPLTYAEPALVPKRTWWRWALAAVLLLALVATGAALLRSEPEPMVEPLPREQVNVPPPASTPPPNPELVSPRVPEAAPDPIEPAKNDRVEPRRTRPKKKKKKTKPPKQRTDERGHDRNALEDPF